MCGLFGLYSTVITKNDQELFFDLGIVSSLRGLDSTGMAIAYRTKKNNFTFASLKDATDPIGFFNQRAVLDRLSKLNRPVAYLGHTRSATIGTVKKDNAHPFFHGNILGMHNGTIPSLKPADGSTDSEELIKRINSMGLQGALDSINGDAAYALTWFNARTQTLHILRNKERTLWHMYSLSGHTMVYASEKAFLDLISARSLGTWKNPQPFNVDQLYTFKLPDMDASVEEARPKTRPFFPPIAHFGGRIPERQILPMLPPPKTSTEGTTGDGGVLTSVFRKESENDPPFEVTDRLGVTPNQWDPPTRYFKDIPIGGYPHRLTVNGCNKLLWYTDYYGNPQLLRTIVPILQNGCCISVHKPEVYERVLWIGPGVFVMPKYANDDFVRNYVQDNRVVWGAPIYATTASVANYRKMKRTWLTHQCNDDDEGAHHEGVQVN